MKHSLLLLFSIIQLCSASSIASAFGAALGNIDLKFCVINIKTKISGGGDYERWPLVIDPSNVTFKEVNKYGNIFIGQDEEIRIACPGTNNKITVLGRSDVKVKCENGEIFKYEGWTGWRGSFYSLGCNSVNYLNLNYLRLKNFILET